MIIAVHPSNLNRGDSEFNINEIIFVMSPFSLSKNKNETTPTSGGAAIGISNNVYRKFLSMNLLYWKM